MTHTEVVQHDKEIRELFRSWTENLSGSVPDWMTPAEYELLHICVREAHRILISRGVFYVHK
jgi:hypothetical protein